MKKILIINVCKEKLQELEFVSPIENILTNARTKFITKSYVDVSNLDLKKADRVIICGTSLKDNYFLKDLRKFSWIKYFDKPILGICAGMQILGLVFKEKISSNLEIGFFKENFKKNFLGLIGELEVYHLHSNFIKFGSGWEIFSEGSLTQAVKKKDKPFYGGLFHPEVRQKQMVLNFLKLTNGR